MVNGPIYGTISYPDFRPYNNIVPFVYSDALSYVEQLEYLKKYLAQTLLPGIDGEISAVVDEFIRVAKKLVDDTNLALDTAVNAILNSSIELQDPVLAAIIGNDLSAARTALSKVIDSISVKESALGISDYTLIQNALTLANTLGVTHINIPDKVAHTPWTFNEGQAPSVYYGQKIWAGNADFYQTGINTPCWYFGPNADRASLVAKNIKAKEARPSYADVTANSNYIRGTKAVANNAGVLCQAEYCYVEANIENFRSGVRASSWDGVTANDSQAQPANQRFNKFRLWGKNNDFLLTWCGQDDMDAEITGSYKHMFNTNDPGHLGYGTVHVNASNRCKVKARASNSSDGATVISVKNNNDFTCSIIAQACVSLLSALGNAGDHIYTDLVGIDMLGVMQNASAAASGATGFFEAIRDADLSEDGGGYQSIGKKTVKTKLVITSLRETPTGNMRILSIKDNWKLECGADITYNSGQTAIGPSSAAIHVYGSNSNLGAVTINNLGNGAWNGINYAAGTTDHRLPISPIISGCNIGVIFGADSGTYVIDPELIIPAANTSLPYSVTGSTSQRISVKGNKIKTRINRYRTYPIGAVDTNHVMAAGTGYYIPIPFSNDLAIALRMKILSAQAGGTISFYFYVDDGTGVPTRKVFTAGSIDASAIAEVETVINYRPAGVQYLFAVSNMPITVQGAAASLIEFNRPSAAAFTKASMVVTAMSPAPDTLGSPVASISTVPQIAIGYGS